jgi:hypothetical protein
MDATVEAREKGRGLPPVPVGKLSKGGEGKQWNDGAGPESRRKNNPLREQKRWLNRLLDEFLVLSRLFPQADLIPAEGGPNWLRRVSLEYANALFHSGVDVKKAKLTPMAVGSFLGYQCAYAVWMVESIDAMITEAEARPEKLKEVSQSDVERGRVWLRKMGDWYGSLRRLAGRALKSAVYQSYEGMSDFLRGFANAFSRKPKLGAGFGNFGSSNFRIYHFMVWNWRVVDGLDSVRAFHALLRKHVGESATGDLKRIEKICQRVGLHFRKPGRPRSREIIQTAC